MSDAEDRAFYFALEQARRGATMEQLRNALLTSGWPAKEAEHILHRVGTQLQGVAAAAAVKQPINHRSREKRKQQERPHAHRAFADICRRLTGGALDLDRLNFMGPLMLSCGGLFLVLGLLGTLLMVMSSSGEHVKVMVFPVLIGVTFVKAGLDTYRDRARQS